MSLKVKAILEKLKFQGINQVLDETLARAQAEALPVETVLELLLTEEYCVFRSKRPPNSAKAATLEIGGRRIALFILSGRFDQVHIGFLLRLDTPDRGGLFTVFSLRLSYSFSDAVSKGCARVLRLDSPLRAIR